MNATIALNTDSFCAESAGQDASFAISDCGFFFDAAPTIESDEINLEGEDLSPIPVSQWSALIQLELAMAWID